ncbi:MAG: Phage capsid family protein [Syntrophus sp. PtaU1.Bin005]|nr:MAG: Phage capsid family protein [Syntrophus sp. PtaU1.Bin005]
MEKRNFEIDVGSIRAESRTVSASLSSEFPVQRYDGEEILSHKPGAVDLSRAPLPLLRAHDNSSLPVGVVEKLAVEGAKLRGTIRLSANQDALWTDITDGILRNLSIGYQILEKQKTKRGIIATKWMPYEVSLVAAPADNTVGINRGISPQGEKKKMDRNDILKAKKAAIDEMAELAKSGENAERLAELKGEIRAFDARLEAFEMAESGRKDVKGFTPEVKKTDRSIIEFTGGSATNRTFAGMFNQGRALEVNEEAIRAFRASMVEGVPSSGGLSVPEPLAAKWLDDSIESEIIRPRATVWPMESATRKVPGWDANTQTGGSMFGGFAMEFLAEEGTGNKQTGKLRCIELAAKKGAIFVDASNELVEDGLGFDAQLDRAMRSSIGYGLDKYFISGTGAGQPLGIRNDPAKVQVAKETGQMADSVVWENVAKMYARMYPAGQRRAVWICNNNAIVQLLTLSMSIGTGGEVIPVMNEESGQFKILGRPVIFTSHMPTVGDADDIMFCDLSQYAIGMRRELRLEKSNIPGWTSDLMSYRALLRFDGMGTWNAPITPENGDTLSWCVGLAERAA